MFVVFLGPIFVLAYLHLGLGIRVALNIAIVYAISLVVGGLIINGYLVNRKPVH